MGLWRARQFGKLRIDHRLHVVKRISPVIILGAIAAFFLWRRREAEVVIPDAAWNPVEPS